ncbi:hypothetical protein OJ998_11500 [Solirubrobacter taibaiensis]|nr:hypothetical protein [Solirubrobacter taibaiensis]
MALLDDSHKTLENVVVLHLVQSMLGLVGPTLNAVAAEVTPAGLVVHFAFSTIGEAEREDVEDVIGDLDALLDNETLPARWPITSELYVGGADEGWPGIGARRVFETKRT